MLDEMPAHLGGMQAGSATNQHHLLQTADVHVRKLEIGQRYSSAGEIDAVAHGGDHGLRLLHDFFEHEVPVAAPIDEHVFQRH